MNEGAPRDRVHALAVVAVVNAGFRLTPPTIAGAIQVGDYVAPRTMLEAVLEGRRAAAGI